MKKNIIWALLMALGFPVLLLAADPAAATLPAAPATLADLIPYLILLVKEFLAAAVGAAMSPVLQAAFEHIIDDALPIWLTPFKALVPSAISYALKLIADHLGVDPAQSWAAAITLAGGAHLVNGSSFAADKNATPSPQATAAGFLGRILPYLESLFGHKPATAPGAPVAATPTAGLVAVAPAPAPAAPQIPVEIVK